MKTRSWVWLVIGFLGGIGGTGCVYSHRAPAVVYTPASPPPAVIVAPTSDRVEPRVYAPSPAAPTSPPPGVSSADVAVADSVRQLLKGNSDLTAVAHNVEATVDHGVVTLRGTVPAEHVKDEIVERVRSLPGVVQVRDHLAVDLR